MRTFRAVLIPVVLAAVLTVCARAQNPAPATAGDAPSAQTPAQQPSRMLAKEMWIHVPGAFPNGLDALEVRMDLPGRHPLVVLTHGTSNEPDARAHVTPWAQFSQAEWFAERGYVAIVVVRRGYGRSSGQQDSANGGCGARLGSF